MAVPATTASRNIRKTRKTRKTRNIRKRTVHDATCISGSISIACGWPVVCRGKRKAPMACRIDRLQAERDLVVLRISGRIALDDIEIIRAAIDQEPGAIAIDLEEVSLVDRSAVDLLALSEARGVTLRNCPPYIREWIAREREQP